MNFVTMMKRDIPTKVLFNQDAFNFRHILKRSVSFAEVARTPLWVSSFSCSSGKSFSQILSCQQIAPAPNRDERDGNCAVAGRSHHDTSQNIAAVCILLKRYLVPCRDNCLKAFFKFLYSPAWILFNHSNQSLTS